MKSTLAYHQMKHKQEAVNQIGRHNEREEDDKTNHSNENIDKERTGDNIFLKRSSGSYMRDIKEIVSSRTDKKIRKNAVVMVGHTLQLGGDALDIPEEEQIEILRKGYEFISNRYGESNVISATIHRDETNPHLHVDMVPMTEDGRLSARDVVTRRELRDVQKDFLEFMQTEYPELGFDRLDENERSFSNGLAQKDFERLSKEAEQLEQAKAKHDVRDNMYNRKRSKLDDRERSVEEREKGLETRETALEERETALEERERRFEQCIRQKEQQNREKEQRNREKEQELAQKRSKIDSKAFELESRGKTLRNDETALEHAKKAFKTYANEKEQSFDERERKLEERERKNIVRASEIDSKAFELEEREKGLEARETALEERESAFNEFVDKKVRDIEERYEKEQEWYKGNNRWTEERLEERKKRNTRNIEMSIDDLNDLKQSKQGFQL